MRRFALKAIMAVTALLLIISCKGGNGNGSGGAPFHFGGETYIHAELISFPAGSAPPDFQSASVYVINDSTGDPIPDATVTINDVSLVYNDSLQEYVGNPPVDPGTLVTLVVSANSKTYTATGNQFASYPMISAPEAEATWETSSSHTVSWSAVAPETDAFYGLGIMDADSGNGLVWPLSGYLQTIQRDIHSYSVPANTLSVGNRLVILGIARDISIPYASGGSSLVISGVSSVPIKVADGSGTHWTQRQAGWSTADFYDVTWSGTQFVTVGGFSGTIFTSPDGSVWSEQSAGTPGPLHGVAWDGNQFVAVGGTTALTSPDGVTWTSHNSGTTASLSGVIWAGNRFVALGNSYSSSTGYVNSIHTSNDGVTWTTTLLDTKVYLYNITWSGSLFVAVGGLSPSGSPEMNAILTSQDGVTWTSRTAGTSNQLLGVTWSGAQFVIVGMGGTVLTSPDGITWTTRNSGTTTTLFNVAWSGTKFVAVGMNRIILTSPDGITWTPVPANYIYTCDLYDIIWSGIRFVAVGEGGAIFTSP